MQSHWYQLKKFCQRYRIALTFVAVVIAGLAISNFMILQQRNRAIVAEQTAQQHLAQAREVANYMSELYLELGLRNETLAASNVLDSATARLNSEINLPKEVRLDLYLSVGEAYLNIYQYEASQEVYEQAAELASNQPW